MELILPANIQPLPVPQTYDGRRQIRVPGFPIQIDTLEQLDAFFNQKIHEFEPSSTAAQKLAFRIIQHTRMTPKVLHHLCKQYLPSFSSITWQDVFPSFAPNLDTTYYSDHRSIPGYLLKRSRVLISIFETLLAELDVARRNVGERGTLENEAAVQLAIHPIPNTVLSLFHGRLTNMPEHLMKGQMASSGRCEFTVTFHGRLVLLFIELKHSLAVSNEDHADMVAQVLAEADGADTANQSKEFDGVPIHAILTDGIHYEFYWISFNSWTVFRGAGAMNEGITVYGDPGRISLPNSERAPDYVGQLKIILEVLLDTFLQTYINGICASREYSR
jgi:hypothetical protein